MRTEVSPQVWVMHYTVVGVYINKLSYSFNPKRPEKPILYKWWAPAWTHNQSQTLNSCGHFTWDIFLFPLSYSEHQSEFSNVRMCKYISDRWSLGRRWPVGKCEHGSILLDRFTKVRQLNSLDQILFQGNSEQHKKPIESVLHLIVSVNSLLKDGCQALIKPLSAAYHLSAPDYHLARDCSHF